MSNNFIGDSSCKALWRFESGELTADSIGTNTLTDYNTVGTNTTLFKEGSASADFEKDASERLVITDASLDSGFPGKSGESNGSFTCCSWMMFESITFNRGIFAKFNNTSGQRGYQAIVGTSNVLTFQKGVAGDGSSVETYLHGSALTTGRWYHFGISYDDSTKALKIRIWDDTAGAIHGSDIDTTTTTSIWIGDASLTLGKSATGFHDGELDEFVVFNRALSFAEIDSIRSGEFGAGSGGGTLTTESAWKIYTAAEIDTAWRIRAALSQSAAWAVFTRDDTASAWSIRTSSQAETAWTVRADLETETSWPIATAADTPTEWQIKAGVDTETSWPIFTAVDTATAWSILDSLALETPTAWSIRNALAADAAWSIRTALDTGSAWAILSRLDRETAWQILGAGILDTPTAWAIRADLDQATAWTIKTSLAADTDWTIVNGMDTATAWDILQGFATDTDWQVFQGLDTATAWSIISDMVPEPVRVFMAEPRDFIINAEKRIFILLAERK